MSLSESNLGRQNVLKLVAGECEGYPLVLGVPDPDAVARKGVVGVRIAISYLGPGEPVVGACSRS